VIGFIQRSICETVIFLFICLSLTSQAGELKHKHYIYDKGKIYKSKKTNVYIDEKGVPTLVIKGKRRLTHRSSYTARKKQRVNPSIARKTHTNKTMEAIFNSAAGLIKKPQPKTLPSVK